MTPFQVAVTSSKRTSPVVPNMELLYGNKCTTKAKEMLQKARQPKHDGHKTILKNMPNTASPCQKLGGLKNRLLSMTNLHCKITPILQQERKEIVTRKIGYSN